MFCWIFRWKISQFHDLEQPLAGMTARHVDRCSRCSGFDQSLQSLEDRLRRSADEFMRVRNHTLEEKVAAELRNRLQAMVIPRRGYRPVYAAAVSIVVAAIVFIIVFRLVPGKKTELSNPFTLKSAASINAPVALKGMVAGMEATFVHEINRLKQHLKSATRSLADGFKLE